MRTETRNRIALEVLDWRHEKLIDGELATLLALRFDAGPTLRSTTLRWLGFFAMLMFGMSVLGFIGAVLGEAAMYLAPFLLGALSATAWYFGARMASHPEQRYPFSGAVVLTSGLIGLFGTLTLFLVAFGGEETFETLYPAFMLVTAAAALATAYRYGLRWPLALGILLFFHALGNWHSYAGHGAYFLGVQDERITAFAGALALGLGLWHEHRWERDAEHRWVGFGHAFVVFGLFYINLCTWFLSLFPGGLAWVLTFTFAGIVQLAVGARLHDSRFVGFGVVFLSIDLYTRFFEQFWDSLSRGVFFLSAGLIGVVAGSLMEMKARRRRRATPA